MPETLTRDWIFAAKVSLAVFFALTGLTVFGGWWYQDAPFPAPAVVEARGLGNIPVEEGEIAEGTKAELLIPHLGIRAPIVWSTRHTEADLQRDLEYGAIHYPGTALPGETGNAFIAAHASAPFWKRGKYGRIFARLQRLDVGDEDIFVVYRNEGNDPRQLQFRVTEKLIVRDTDPRLFAFGKKKELTLVTCWPVGTRWRRLMINTELVRDSQQE